jgi:transposase
MSGEKLSMRTIKEILRLKRTCGLSNRAIARSCGIGRATVSEYLRRAKAAGLSWPLDEQIDDAHLERLLFPPPCSLPSGSRPVPDWSVVHSELRKKGVTLCLLWEEYYEAHPGGYQYSWFCEHYQTWTEKLDLVMRQDYRAGEKLFVDYAGQTVSVVNAATGETREAQVFIAVLGASNYTYAEATWTQSLPDWINSHVRAFEFFQGVPELIIPDNLKSGVSKACRYEPDLNPTYQEMATHYGCAVIPARVRKPRDKAKVEAGVQVVERWVLARLRHRTFFSLQELNREIHALIDRLNNRPFKKLPGSRRSLFESLDSPALKPLPMEPYVYAEWKKAKVHIDYHIEVEGHYYSVPYQLVKEPVEARITGQTIEIFHKGRRIACHRRSHHKGHHTTVVGHMPKPHQQYLQWTPQRLAAWAGKTGESTRSLIEAIIRSRVHPQQGFRSALGIMRLEKDYGSQRLESACKRALTFSGFSFKSVQAILKSGLDQQPLSTPSQQSLFIHHPNIRGAQYYQ